MKKIKIFHRIGKRKFAENKDIGQHIRINDIMPQLETGKEIILDFENIDRASQSFIHSLISDAIRKYGADKTLDLVVFKSCNEHVRGIIAIVVEYMQDAMLKEKES